MPQNFSPWCWIGALSVSVALVSGCDPFCNDNTVPTSVVVKNSSTETLLVNGQAVPPKGQTAVGTLARAGEKVAIAVVVQSSNATASAVATYADDKGCEGSESAVEVTLPSAAVISIMGKSSRISVGPT